MRVACAADPFNSGRQVRNVPLVFDHRTRCGLSA
jgi:hypothetical protein